MQYDPLIFYFIRYYTMASRTCFRLLNHLGSSASRPYWTYYAFVVFMLCQVIRDNCG